MIYIYLNKHLQVKVRWDFNKTSTTGAPPKSFVNPRHTSEVIDKRLLRDITVVNFFFKVSMTVQCKSLLGITQRNLEPLGKLKLSKQLAKKVKIT